MTAKQYYKQTSDMAYQLDDYTVEYNRIHARIQLTDTSITIEDILKNNDFFAIKGFNGDLDTGNPMFDITFIIDSKHYDIYDLTVCDIIDCRSVDGCSLVLSCSDYELVESIEEPDEISEDCEVSKEPGITVSNKNPFESMFKVFDDFSRFTLHSFDNVFTEWDEKFKNLKDNGGKYCSVTCKLDGNGNGYYCKVDNDGVVEKTFKKVGGEYKEIGDANIATEEPPKKSLKDML